MANENTLTAELASKLNGIAIVSSDIKDSDLEGRDMEALWARIVSFFEGKEGIKILDSATLASILEKQQEEKAPVPVEIIRPTEFKPEAEELPPDFKIMKKEARISGNTSEAFVGYFKDRFSALRDLVENGRSTVLGGTLRSLDKIKEYANGREVSIVGMVYDKITTKNGHILLTLEDESGTAKVLFLHSDTPELKALFENAGRIVNDDVIAVKGKISGPFVIANMILWPDIPIHERKKSREDTNIAFISDIHIGSRFFIEKQFNAFLGWLNGRVDYRRDLAGKVKYIIANGDLVDGIGVYPNQERELTVDDIYKQYSILFSLLNAIPEYIQVFVIPGNHDAVRRAEPQPELPKEFYSNLGSNIHLLQNPSYIEIAGQLVLAYHGASLDSVIHQIPNCSYSKPETAMTELLRRRHLSPIYGGNIIAPSDKDALVIDKVPDIFHVGHIHKNGSTDYHGTLLINSGTWQARTSFQVKQGHVPSPCLLPVYQTAQDKLVNIDFNNLSESAELEGAQ